MSYQMITDHCECHDYDGAVDGVVYRETALASYRALKKQIGALGEDEPCRLLCGVELGQPLQGLAAAEELVSRSYDFVLASIHNITGYEDFYFWDYDQTSDGEIDRLLHQYFREILETVQWGHIDALAHLTYPMRYIVGEYKREISLEPHMAQIQEIFKTMIQKGIALEVNTAGFRQAIGRASPDLPLLRQYFALGGRLVTLGSDAHRIQDVGKGLPEGMALLREAGFQSYAVYIDQKPCMIPILEA